mgnify:CR=1 FL=1
MAINHITYTKSQMYNMSVSGYAIYINENYSSSYETLTIANTVAKQYPHYNEIEIYPVLKRKIS